MSAGTDPIRVGVAGAAGRMGQTVCAAVEGAEDMTLAGRADPALGVALADILGGASSSRLFQEVREKRGLAYNVYSFQSMYAGTGQVGLYLGTRPDNVVRAMSVVADELERMRQDPASDDELARSKENVKGRIVLSLESTAARMNRLGASVLADMPLMSGDEVIERIESVTIDDLTSLVDELWAPGRLSAAGIGPDRERFEQALAAVEPTLAQSA